MTSNEIAHHLIEIPVSELRKIRAAHRILIRAGMARDESLRLLVQAHATEWRLRQDARRQYEYERRRAS
jgi:hypothetical protein